LTNLALVLIFTLFMVIINYPEKKLTFGNYFETSTEGEIICIMLLEHFQICSKFVML